MNDMIGVYLHFLELGEKVTGIYNAGFENITILELANKIKKHITTKVCIEESNDPRSYRQNSDKLASTGFTSKYNIEEGIKDVINAYNTLGLKDEEKHYNLKAMKKNNILF